jgi:hypothetical protein
MQNKIFYFICILILGLVSCGQEKVQTIELGGVWRFATDVEDKGTSEKWYAEILKEEVNLPGSMVENGKGDEITVNTHWTGNMWNDSLWYTSPEFAKYREPGNVKANFWLTPEKKYYGPAWYQKEINIPKDWKNQTIQLHLERPHWESKVWIDDQLLGMENYLATPHEFELPENLSPGKHTLTIRIDNRVKDINVGRDAHSISDNTQSNWNGIVGKLALNAKTKAHIKGVKITPNVKMKKIKVRVITENNHTVGLNGKIIIAANGIEGNNDVLAPAVKTVQVEKTDTHFYEYSMGPDPMLWDEFDPSLYQLEVILETDLGLDKQQEVFGMRNFEVEDKHFTINGRPIFLRGTLECAIFPLTGYPPTDPAAWERIYDIIQDHGLNHMRFHSWCPPEAAFTAADKKGIYLQVEASVWTTVGDGEPIDRWVYKEAQNILDQYGNHPSFVMMAYGNEPGGKNHPAYLTDFINYFRVQDPDKIFTGGAGWPLLENADYYNGPQPRIQRWNEQLNSIINSKPPQTEFDYLEFIEKTPIATVSHEIGQWCVYPNFAEMPKYTGVLKPKNFEIYEETLNENGMSHLADTFLMASGKLQAICYKADIEAALRTKGMAGFQLLDLHDFPGQGTALVGVLDAFWDEKGYISPGEFRKFCDVTVPLVRMDKRTFSNSESFHATVEVAHFGPEKLKAVVPEWRIFSTTGETLFDGRFSETEIPIGNGTSLGKIDVALSSVNVASKLTLEVAVGEQTNSWPFWVYPADNQVEGIDKNIKMFSSPSPAMVRHLENGGKAILSVSQKDLTEDAGGNIGIGFSSIFWNTAWTKGQKPHTLGLVCDTNHPALAYFPTDYHSDWQWWDAVTNGASIVYDEISEEINPIVRVIDDWNKNRPTALLFEVKVGKGKLMIAGVDLINNLPSRIEARQLLFSLKIYMSNEGFNPQEEVDFARIKALYKTI